MAKKVKEKSAKKSFLRRLALFFLRFLGVLGLTIVFILLLLVILFRFVVPSDYVKAKAAQFVETSFSRKLVIDKIHINPLTGVELTNVRLEKLPDSLATAVNPPFPVDFAAVKSVRLKYSLKRLLKKELRISEVILDTPQIEAFLTLAPDTTQKVKPDSVAQPVSPLALELNKLRIKDAQIKITTQDSSLTQKVFLEDLDVYIDQITVPRGNILANDSLLRGAFKINSENADFSFEQVSAKTGNMSVNGNIDLATELNVVTLDSVTLDARLLLEQLFFASTAIPNFSSLQMPFSLNLDLSAVVNVNAEKARLTRMNVSVDDKKWLGLTAEVQKFISTTSPQVSARIEHCAVPVEQVMTLGKLFVADSLLPELAFHNQNAALVLKDTWFSGTPPDSLPGSGLNFHTKVEFLDFGVTMDKGQAELEKLNFSAEASGKLVLNGIAGLNLNTTLSIDSTFYAISDTLAAYTGKILLTMNAGLNDKMLPRFADVNFSIANALGTNLNSQIHINNSNTIKSISGAGEIAITNIDTKNFPSPVQTRGELQTSFTIKSIDDITARIKFVTDSLVVPFEYEQETLPSIYFLANADLGADTLFQNIRLKSLTMQLNDLLTARASGRVVQGGKEKVEMKLENLLLRHAAIFDWLPDRLRQQFADLKVTGNTQLEAVMTGKVKPKTLDYQVNAHLFTNQTGVTYPSQLVDIGGIKLDVVADLNSAMNTLVKVALNIDTVHTDMLSKASMLLNNSIALEVTSKDMLSFQVNKGKINLPDLKAGGSFNADINNVDTNPQIAAMLWFKQDAPDSLKITPEFVVRGVTDLLVQVNMDTALLNLSGSLKTKNLTLFLPQQTRVQDINADLKFDQALDLVNQIFLESEKPPILTPTDGSVDYLVYRPYYRQTLPEVSYLSIGKIQAAGYEIDNFNMEAILGRGRIDIPSYYGSVYGGNIGGRISINLAGGDINQATYQLSGHFSGINSDLLLAGIKRDKSLGVINANAQFSGTGLNIAQGLDIKGDFYITEIGPKVADNLLRSLDPEGVDSGIRTTRRLINLGFKPQLFTFSFKYGFFYTFIDFSQPWYFPAKLSGSKIELNRKPINFFIQMALAKTASLKS
ncbi:MAG TPA: AsmA family protein [bacterium]|nr:AsmA family protein [bacterium]HPN42686.1 AsmA family protein [bacterium]